MTENTGRHAGTNVRREINPDYVPRHAGNISGIDGVADLIEAIPCGDDCQRSHGGEDCW